VNDQGSNDTRPGPTRSVDVDALLRRIEQGDADAGPQLFEALYTELRAQAARTLVDGPRTPTLHATVLVHEAYLRLARGAAHEWRDREAFLSYAAKAMRHALVDYCRAKRRGKRTAPGERVEFQDVAAEFEQRALDIEALDAALAKLAGFDPDMARAVELRFFGGSSVEETARMVGMPLRTFERRWNAARAWLKAEVS
jgi:RNA polymerase sigma factor (TIGR02999 family)